MISLQGCFIGRVRTSSPVIFALCQISTKIPLFGDRIWGLNLLYHLLLVLWEAYSWYIWFTFSLSVGSIWTTRTQECITACAVTARSSGKDREVLKDNSPPDFLQLCLIWSLGSIHARVVFNCPPHLPWLLWGELFLWNTCPSWLFPAFRAVNETS